MEAGEIDLEALVRNAFKNADVQTSDVSVRQFPGEIIIIVEVGESAFSRAVTLANAIVLPDPQAFVTVRKVADQDTRPSTRVSSLNDPRITALVELIEAKSRTSESQASLEYIQDVGDNLAVCLTHRHHLIFGRRGVGKTALMVEAKRVAEASGNHAFWLNVQTLGSLSADAAFATTMLRILDLPQRIYGTRANQPMSVRNAEKVSKAVREYLESGSRELGLLIADCQQVLNLLGHETQSHAYLFLDDIHYLRMSEQPKYLHMLHAITRDNNVWIKAAGIRHQCRWFMDNPPTGLQTGQDASLIPLDITLETPDKARDFLVKIISTYVDQVKISSALSFLPQSSIDRLVLASGGVPRDFLVLTGRALQVARHRPKARAVGIQDVNEAAGQLAKVKLQELEQDAAASIGSAAARVNALNLLSDFLLNKKQTTYFKVAFRDKEKKQREYDLLQSLMDLRMIHLIHGSLSDEHQAGERAEVYMLDLSKFSGTRFKHKLRVLDFRGAFLILKTTGTTELPRVADTPKKLLAVLRRGPTFELEGFAEFIAAS